MPRVMETTVFKFSELSDTAKEKAREWYRECALDYEWWEYVYEDASHIAELLGIELRQKPVKLMNGKTRYEPCIWFSGFSSQGDGACWEGTYSYKKGSVAAVKQYAPQDRELYEIADELYRIQRRYFYKVTASVKHRGHYYHSGCMDVDVTVDSEQGFNCADEVTQLLRDFADWIYKRLEGEHDYRLSDECVDDTIEVNEYEFDEDGHRA